MKLKRYFFICFASAILLLVLFGIVFTFWGHNYHSTLPLVLFEKNESWGPCVEKGACWRDTLLYSHGELLINGINPEYYALSSEQMNLLEAKIEETGIMGKNCSAPLVLDYWSETTIFFNGEIKVINYPGCEQELDEIEKLIFENK